MLLHLIHLAIPKHKTSQSRMGYVAEVCPNCMAVRRFELFSIDRALSLHGMPVEAGRTIGHGCRCTSCHRTFGVNGDLYPFVAIDSSLSIDALIQQTAAPGFVERAANAAAFVHRINTNQLTPQDRIQTVLRAVTSNEEDWRRGSVVHVDAISCALLVIIAVAGVWWLIEMNTQRRPEAWKWLALATSLSALVAMVWSCATSNRRYVTARMEPRVASELTAIKPSAAEINDGCQMAIRSGLRIARHIDPERLERRIAGA